MSARAWRRRRRHKGVQQAIAFVEVYPDKYVVLGSIAILGISLAQRCGVMPEEAVRDG